jgi:3alpha(or 20beta)-hydroxysteroid dehydrogenase
VVTTAVESFGGVDILINNAGVCIAAALEDLTMASFKETLDINLVGVMQGMQAVLPAMRARGKGSIVNISSVAGLQGGNGLGAYGASKWAVRGLTKFAALEFGLYKIRVNTVHPGPVDTPMGNPIGAPRAALDSMAKWLPLRRFAGPEEIAHASLYLASDDAGYVNGAELAVDGGWSAGDYEPALPGGPQR